jgi:putative oxidoreductase
VCKKIESLYFLFIKTVTRLNDVLLLLIRLWMANVFWKSGILKIQDWGTTILLFTDEHPVPFLPPEFAALSGTAFELLCPVLLVLGLGSRLATLPLLAMTAVIQFTYLDNVEHYYWAFLLAVILCAGAGRLSADFFIKKRFGR